MRSSLPLDLSCVWESAIIASKILDQVVLFNKIAIRCAEGAGSVGAQAFNGERLGNIAFFQKSGGARNIVQLFHIGVDGFGRGALPPVMEQEIDTVIERGDRPRP